jgi:hypothetical protein
MYYLIYNYLGHIATTNKGCCTLKNVIVIYIHMSNFYLRIHLYMYIDLYTLFMHILGHIATNYKSCCALKIVTVICMFVYVFLFISMYAHLCYTCVYEYLHI